MGRFIYGTAGNSVDIEDRALAHLRIVIMNKLRRGESFMFDVEVGDDSGRRSFWLSPSVPIQFHFFGQPPTPHQPGVGRGADAGRERTQRAQHYPRAGREDRGARLTFATASLWRPPTIEDVQRTCSARRRYSTIAISWGVRLSRRPPSAVTVTMSSMRTPNRPGR